MCESFFMYTDGYRNTVNRSPNVYFICYDEVHIKIIVTFPESTNLIANVTFKIQ
jgi:hypothetical protein